MLHFEMSPDPEDRDANSRAFSGPLGTNILLVGDFIGQDDQRPIDDRYPIPVHRDDLGKVLAQEKFTSKLTNSVRQFVEQSPSGTQIELLNASQSDLICDFEDAPTLRKSGFFRAVNSRNHQGMRPYSLLVFLDSANGYLLQQLALVARAKNTPILFEGAAVMDPAKLEAKFVVPCPRGAITAAGEVLTSFLSNAAPPNLSTCAGTSLSALLWLTRFAQQILHIDYHRGSPSQDRNAEEMTEILNRALETRLRHLPDISARVDQFEWQNRPYAETNLSVTAPGILVRDRIVLQFEFS